MDDHWQIDLADIQNISKYNDNYRYLVTFIDVFSKLAWVIPIKNKQARCVLEPFKMIIEISSRKPNNLQSDKGLNF